MSDTKEQLSPEELNKALFVNMIMMFSSSVLQHLGRIPDPGSGQAQVDLQAAQTSIDLLDMLEQKTKGNLDEDETQMLTETLSALKMQFVQASNAQGDSPVEPSEPAPPEATPETGASEAEPQVEVPEESGGRTKFHKSYD
jgi:hypothetical protein